MREVPYQHGCNTYATSTLLLQDFGDIRLVLLLERLSWTMREPPALSPYLSKYRSSCSYLCFLLVQRIEI